MRLVYKQMCHPETPHTASGYVLPTPHPSVDLQSMTPAYSYSTSSSFPGSPKNRGNPYNVPAEEAFRQWLVMNWKTKMAFSRTRRISPVSRVKIALQWSAPRLFIGPEQTRFGSLPRPQALSWVNGAMSGTLPYMIHSGTSGCRRCKVAENVEFWGKSHRSSRYQEVVQKLLLN